ncbi:MAG TPA: hypothetical protein VLG28_07220 [Acidimicrobiia bacterium]|nr:hypothetical protein [Acidimicrobiia bacterium]
MPFGEGVTRPAPPASVTLNLSTADGSIDAELELPQDVVLMMGDEPVEDLDDQEGWQSAVMVLPFTADLDPGNHLISSITVEDAAWHDEPVVLSTVEAALSLGAEFNVAEAGCTYVGDFSFVFWRLPPGSVEEQSDMAVDLSTEMNLTLYMVPSESGTFLLDRFEHDMPPPEAYLEFATECEAVTEDD